MLIPHSGLEPVSKRIPSYAPKVAVVFVATFIIALVLSVMYARHYYDISEMLKIDLQNYKLASLESENIREAEYNRLQYETDEYKNSIEGLRNSYEERLELLKKDHAIEIDRYKQTLMDISVELESIAEIRNALTDLYNQASLVMSTDKQLDKLPEMSLVDFNSGTTLFGASAAVYANSAMLADDLHIFNEELELLRDYVDSLN